MIDSPELRTDLVTDLATLFASEPVQLVIGNKNYSSWSMRGWLLLTKAGVDFEEVSISFGDDDYRAQLSRYSPSGRVPVVVSKHAGRAVVAIWDSLAIAECMAELCPELWPGDPWARAEARSMASEMHAGFAAIRNQMPLNCRARRRRLEVDSALRVEIDRIGEIWAAKHRRQASRQLDASLDGDPSGESPGASLDIADLMYAPVASRFRTYDIELDEDASQYQMRLLDDADVERWHRLAVAETEVLPMFEVGA